MFFWLQNQKICGKFLQPRNSNRPSTNISNLKSRDTSTFEGETEQTNLPQRFAMIKGWDSKYLWIHVCMQAAREAHFAVSLTACTELADGSKSPELVD